MSSIVHYYRETEPPHSLLPTVKEQLKALNLANDADAIQSIHTESCFNVQSKQPLTQLQKDRLEWLLAETFEKDKLRPISIFAADVNAAVAVDAPSVTLEFGPRMSFASAFSSNAVSICQACGLTSIDRLERSRRYRIQLSTSTSTSTLALALTPRAMDVIHNVLHDKMTEQKYDTPISTFDHHITPEKVQTVPIMEQGRKALEKINTEKGLGFDDFDLDYYTKLFKVSD